MVPMVSKQDPHWQVLAADGAEEDSLTQSDEVSLSMKDLHNAWKQRQAGTKKRWVVRVARKPQSWWTYLLRRKKSTLRESVRVTPSIVDQLRRVRSSDAHVPRYASSPTSYMTAPPLNDRCDILRDALITDALWSPLVPPAAGVAVPALPVNRAYRSMANLSQVGGRSCPT